MLQARRLLVLLIKLHCHDGVTMANLPGVLNPKAILLTLRQPIIQVPINSTLVEAEWLLFGSLPALPKHRSATFCGNTNGTLEDQSSLWL